MPRTYIKKNPIKYDADDLKKAREEVKRGKSVYKVAKKYNIPYETLRRWCVNPPTHQGAGRDTVLNKQEESYIVEALIYTAKCGYPLDRKDVQYMVQSYVQSLGRKTPFKDGIPGYEFLVSFENRWKEQLALRKPELLTKARAEGLSPFVVNEFFKIYQNILDENNLNGHPERIFNLDETGLSTDPTKGKVLVPKRATTTYSRSGSAGKLQYSVLFVASADGKSYPPCVIFKGKGDLHNTWVKGGPPGTLYGVTESGWMQDYAFENWLRAFTVQVKHLEKPILVILDGHGSHLTYNVTCIARENGIIILCIPPNTSHALQPLDVGVFAPVKMAWKDILKSWYRESRLKNVDKAVFPSLLKKLMTTSFRPNQIMGGFRRSGLYPVNMSVLEHKIVSITRTPVIQPIPEKEPEYTTQSMQTEELFGANNVTSNLPRLSTGNTDGSLSQPPSTDAEEINPSPMKKLRSAILMTLSPDQPSPVKAALRNSKAKRRRVQGSCGEVLTTDEVEERLKKEEAFRKEKKKKNDIVPKAITFNTPEKRGLIKKKSAKVAKMSRLEKTKIKNEEDNLYQPSTSHVGSWVSVNYQSECGKIQKEYRGQVIDQDLEPPERYSVKFLRKCKGDGERYIFPDTDDIEWVNMEQISAVFSAS